MSMINFIKKHEKLLQRDDPGKAALVSLKTKLEELKLMQPDYREIANEIYDRLNTEKLLPEFDGEVKVGDEVIGIGTYAGTTVDSLTGKIVAIYVADPTTYAVEWEKKVKYGNSLNGKAKEGYGRGVEIGNLRKKGTFEKPEVKSKRDYDKFLESILDEVSEEYVDHDDKNFEEGDRIEFVRRVRNVWNRIIADVGDRGTIISNYKGGSTYKIVVNDLSFEVRQEYMAKVKKRPKSSRETEIDDEVEFVEKPKLGAVEVGTKGVVKRKDLNDRYVVFNEDNQLGYWVTDSYLRLTGYKSPQQIIEEIEGEEGLPEYRKKVESLFADADKLREEGKVAEEDVSELIEQCIDSTGYMDFPLKQEEDEELEDLLK